MPDEALHSVVDLRPGHHTCCLFDNDAEHDAVLLDYVKIGLDRRELVLYVVSAARREAVLAALRAGRIDVDTYLADGRLRLEQAESFFLHGGVFDPEVMVATLADAARQAVDRGAAALRVASDMDWAAQGAPGAERLLEYEARLQRVFNGDRCLTVSFFDTRAFGSDALLVVLSVHPIVILGRRLYPNIFHMSLEDMAGTDLARGTLTHRLRLLTEWKAKEEHLLEEKRRAGEYLRIAEVIFVALDFVGTVTLINDKGCRLLGLHRRDVIGQDWFETFLPKRLRVPVKGVFVRLMEGEGEWLEYYENPIVTASGEERLIAWHNTLLKDVEGRNVGTLSAGEDITERRSMEQALAEREQRYRRLFEESMDAVFVHDLAGNMLEVNQSACELLGTSAERLLATSVPKLHPQEELSICRWAFEAIRDRGQVRFQSRFLRHDGTLIGVDISASIVDEERGIVQAVVRRLSSGKSDPSSVINDQ